MLSYLRFCYPVPLLSCVVLCLRGLPPSMRFAKYEQVCVLPSTFHGRMACAPTILLLSARCLVLGWRSVVAHRLGAVLRDHVPIDILSLLCHGLGVGRCVHKPRKSRMSAGISRRPLAVGRTCNLVRATSSEYKQSQPSSFETDSNPFIMSQGERFSMGHLVSHP
jgi:hypothetical protein